MTFTGSCLQDLQLEKLHLYEVNGLQKEAFRQALLGRSLKTLILEDTDITPDGLDGLQVQELRLNGVILHIWDLPQLYQSQLYRVLLNLVQRGLKKLDFGDRDDLGEQLKCNPAFAGVEFTTIHSFSDSPSNVD